MTNYNLKERNDNSTLAERLKKIDYLGAITIVSAVICFMLATSMGGNLKAWSDPMVVGCLVASVVLAILFCIVEAKVAQNPLMPWHIVSSQTPLACSLLNFWTLMATMAAIYLVPLYLQVRRKKNILYLQMYKTNLMIYIFFSLSVGSFRQNSFSSRFILFP